MTYQQASGIAIVKRLLGWLLFILALLSTLISILKFMYQHSEKQAGINAVMLDFIHVMIDMVRFNTPFLNVFWFNSPLPDFQQQSNILFWCIFALIFIGLAMKESGARMARQVKFVRENVQDSLIIEQAKGAEGLTKAELYAKINVPNHTLFLQIFPLYILPVVVLVAGYFCFRLLGFI